MVRMPSSASRACIALPTPQIRPTGLSARKAMASAPPITEKPRGLSRSEATLARNLLIGEADRDGDADLRLDPLRKAGQRQRRRGAVQPLGAGEVQEGLVDRQRLDQRRQLLHQRADLAPDRDVFLHVRAG